MGGLSGREFESPHLQKGIAMPRQTDVRVQKTKERLYASLLSLLKEKSIEKVSICEICNRAGVNRNTFYSHYSDIKELLAEIEGGFMEEIISSIAISKNTVESVEDLFLLILDIVESNQDMCTLLFSDNGDKNFLHNILMFAMPSAIQNWMAELGISEDDATLLYYFVMGGAVHTLEAYVKKGISLSKKDLASKLNDMVMKAQEALSISKN